TANGYLGVNGKGIATQWRLTDEPYQGQPATLDFKRWDGTLFEEKPGSKKTESRTARKYRPILPGSTPRTTGKSRTSGNHRKINKSEKPDPVLPGSTFLRSSQSFTVSESVAVPAAEPVTTTPALKTRQRQQDANKAEQDLVEMIIVLRRFLGNAVTSG